jgi:GT2 family glycosyltransferase
LILSQGDGNWPSNFNKALEKVRGRFLKYLHEDDKLTENCIKDSVQALEEQKVDFIHGNAIELNMITNKTKFYKPTIKFPTTSDLMKRNMIHSTTLMYRKELFDEMGGFNESLWVMEEFEYNLRLLSAGKKIGYCDSTLAIYRRHPLQKVRVVPKEIKIKEKELVKSWY